VARQACRQIGKNTFARFADARFKHFQRRAGCTESCRLTSSKSWYGRAGEAGNAAIGPGDPKRIQEYAIRGAHESDGMRRDAPAPAAVASQRELR